jgi:hypothetical protein
MVRAAERAEAHGAALERPDLLDRLGGLLGGRERPLGVRSQHPPGLGEREPPSGAREERDAQLGLEPANLVGEARLRHQQRLGRGGEGALVRGGEEVPELLQRHRFYLPIL